MLFAGAKEIGGWGCEIVHKRTRICGLELRKELAISED